MTFRNILLIFVLAASSLISVEAQVVDYGQANDVCSFESGTDGFKASKHSKLSICDTHSKLGSKSLHWKWCKDRAYIKLNEPVPYLPENPNPKETSVSSFVFWITLLRYFRDLSDSAS